MNTADPFQSFMNFVLASEGVLSMDPNDPGNWTGGAKGKGELRGTKYGVSAKAYPQLDIAHLTPATVQPIYFKDYWTAAGCHLLPPRLAFLTADAAVQHGPAKAVQFLQRAMGLKDDGVCGPVTVNAARTADTEKAVDGSLAQRMRYYMKIDNDEERNTDAGGWSNRMIAVCREVMA